MIYRTSDRRLTDAVDIAYSIQQSIVVHRGLMLF
jgi:hypothetical protein